MSSGWLGASLNQIEKYCQELDLFSERGLGIIMVNGAELSRWSYEKFWRMAIGESWFNIKLKDDSFFYFEEGKPNKEDLKFVYYECPYYPKIDLDDFIQQNAGFDNNVIEQLIGEFELIQDEKKETFTPIRYEYCEKQFKSGVHPASHLHVGSGNEIRIGSFHKLSPFAFFLFVVRQCYPDVWENSILGNSAKRNEAYITLKGLTKVDKKFIDNMVSLEMYLKNEHPAGTAPP